MKFNNWSYDGFVIWLRGPPSLKSGTSEEWAEWRKLARQKKLRCWLAEDGIDYLRDFFSWPFRKLNGLRYYIYNRWIYQSHALVSNLARGQWHELDTCLIHACFDELVNFVEVDEASLHIACSEEAEKYLRPWYYRIFRLRAWRCPEAGLAHLEWAASLKHDEEWDDKESPNYNQPTSQAIAAKETLALYHWWKYERPRRQDPMEASGWSAYWDEKCEQAKARGEEDSLAFLGSDKSPADRERSGKMIDILHAMEEEQENEDTEMLIRLVKNRRALWT